MFLFRGAREPLNHIFRSFLAENHERSQDFSRLEIFKTRQWNATSKSQCPGSTVRCCVKRQAKSGGMRCWCRESRPAPESETRRDAMAICRGWKRKTHEAQQSRNNYNRPFKRLGNPRPSAYLVTPLSSPEFDIDKQDNSRLVFGSTGSVSRAKRQRSIYYVGSR